MMLRSSLFFLLFSLCITTASAFVVQPQTSVCRNSWTPLCMSSETSSTTTTPLFDDYVMNSTPTVQVKDLTMGSGDEVKEGDIITVAYNGKVMQTSQTFGIGSLQFKYGEKRVMPGWNDAIVGMRAGGTRLARIPPSLAYGSMGQATIPPNADLEIAIELEEIENGLLAELKMEAVQFGLGNNVKTYGLLFFTLLLALSPMFPQ